MAHELDPPIPPDLLNPAPHAPLAGDWHDDDAQAYGQDFASAVEGPQERVGIPHAKNEVKTTTLLLSRQVVVGLNGTQVYDPVMLFPADPLRKRVVVKVPALPSQAIAVPNPAVGQEWSYTVPVGQTLNLSSITSFLTASAVAGNRAPGIQIKDSSGVLRYLSVGGGTITPSGAGYIVFASDVAGVGTNLVNGTFPRVILPAGWSISSLTSGLDAGDQYSSVSLIGQANVACVIAGSKSGVYGAAEITDSWDSDNHTGAVWVYAPRALGPITVNGWSIIE